MKTTISFYDFSETFKSSDTYRNNFSHAWLRALFDYLEEYEESTWEEIEFDMVALCCDFTEYENLEAFQKEYNQEDYPDFDSIEYKTTVIYCGATSQDPDSPFIVQAF